MEPLRILSASEQVAEHLRGQLVRWRQEDHVPGVIRLAGELRVGKDTVEAALRQLQDEGLLEAQGHRRRRKVTSASAAGKSKLRITLLNSDPPDLTDQWIRDLEQCLVNAGHQVTMAGRSMNQLGMDPRRVARLVDKTRTDAWLVIAGSTQILSVFAERNLRTMAVAGAWHGLPIAGVVPNKHPALDKAMELLLSRGHQRIAMVTLSLGLSPKLAGFPHRLIEILKNNGIPTGSFNVPVFRDDPEDLTRMLERLFGVTPPTALIIDEARLFFAVQQFLLNRGLKVPEDVSLMCTDGSPNFAWCRPAVAHIRWDFRELAGHVLRWARNVEKGRDYRKQKETSAEFVPGGTIGGARAVPGGSAPTRKAR